MEIDERITPSDLKSNLDDVFAVASRSTWNLRRAWAPERGAPVFTVNGEYSARGWTEWTQGFQFGNALYLFDATGDREMLEYGRNATVRYMYPHLTHTGVHDHGFNNVSTYGNLLRLVREGRIAANEWEAEFYRLALRVSAAVQAARFTPLPGGLGYVASFNGAHSLFADTIRSMRSLSVGHRLGAHLTGEQDERVSLLSRAIAHAETTARYNVYFGEGRDTYDVRGRVAHESLFNPASGSYRAPSTQQGYSPFTTWTRGHSWVLCGYPEQLEYLETLSEAEYEGPEALPTLEAAKRRFLEVACAAADFYLEHTAKDGIPYWDTGAPGLEKLGDWRANAADPYNRHEPVDSSAAAISAQGLIRLGRYLKRGAPAPERIPAGGRIEGSAGKTGGRADARGAADASKKSAAEPSDSTDGFRPAAALGDRYLAAGLTAARTLFADPYLARDRRHQGILLHSVYHRPNGWDYDPDHSGVPRGEACMWGDYHLLELAVLVQRLSTDGPYHAFFNV
ncbi:MAG: hypothetical protein ACLFM0_04190 [Spirochaetales bacterium]